MSRSYRVLSRLELAARLTYTTPKSAGTTSAWRCHVHASTIGKTAIGYYLGHASVGSAYGTAGSMVVLLVWVYYSALIMFFVC